jgi:hypothetical protein
VKKAIVVIVLFALVWAIPAARTKFIDVTHPVFARLGPVGNRVTTPMRKYTARTQIASILRAMHAAREAGKEVPDGRTFVRWLRAHPPSDRKEMDPWGNSYWMRKENASYIIGSNGPDGIKGNADDVTKTVIL